MNDVTTWGELNRSWLNKFVIVRWEDASLPMAEGFPSGIPHEWRGYIRHDAHQYFLSTHPLEAGPLADATVEQQTLGFPKHALVQETT